MTQISHDLMAPDIQDAYRRPLRLGDRAVELNTGALCVIADHCPELGPESLLVELVEHDGPPLSYWVEPTQLVGLADKSA
jgi:hypothetical protein